MNREQLLTYLKTKMLVHKKKPKSLHFSAKIEVYRSEKKMASIITNVYLLVFLKSPVGEVCFSV